MKCDKRSLRFDNAVAPNLVQIFLLLLFEEWQGRCLHYAPRVHTDMCSLKKKKKPAASEYSLLCWLQNVKLQRQEIRHCSGGAALRPPVGKHKLLSGKFLQRTCFHF